MAGTKIKTKVNDLKYVYITGEGKNQAMPGEPERMQFVASIVMPENSEAHKYLLQQIDSEWDAYKKQFSVKGRPKTNGIKAEFTKDPTGAIDPETEEIAKIPTGNVIVTFKTNTTWPDGNAQVVKVKDRKGGDITKAIQEAAWSIGEGSLGIIHGTAMGNNAGGKHKVTLYLAAIQLAKLVKYEGNDVDCDEIDGEDLDLDNGATEISTSEESALTRPEL